MDGYTYSTRFRLSERNWHYLLRLSRRCRGRMSRAVRRTIREAAEHRRSGVDLDEPYGMERSISLRLDWETTRYLTALATRATKGNLSEALRRILNEAEALEHFAARKRAVEEGDAS